MAFWAYRLSTLHFANIHVERKTHNGGWTVKKRWYLLKVRNIFNGVRVTLIYKCLIFTQWCKRQRQVLQKGHNIRHYFYCVFSGGTKRRACLRSENWKAKIILPKLELNLQTIEFTGYDDVKIINLREFNLKCINIAIFKYLTEQILVFIMTAVKICCIFKCNRRTHTMHVTTARTYS